MNRNRITAIIFFILLIVSCSGIAAASGIREMISFFGNGESFGYEITAQAVKLPQFDENRTETLNRLLRHFSFSGRLDAREATLTVSMDGQKLFALSETEVGGTTTAALETDSNSFVIIPEDENEEKNGVFTGGVTAVSENLSLYTALEEYAADVSLIEVRLGRGLGGMCQKIRTGYFGRKHPAGSPEDGFRRKAGC